jgi:hypothetical protein
LLLMLFVAFSNCVFSFTLFTCCFECTAGRTGERDSAVI